MLKKLPTSDHVTNDITKLKAILLLTRIRRFLTPCVHVIPVRIKKRCKQNVRELIQQQYSDLGLHILCTQNQKQ